MRPRPVVRQWLLAAPRAMWGLVVAATPSRQTDTSDMAARARSSWVRLRALVLIFMPAAAT